MSIRILAAFAITLTWGPALFAAELQLSISEQRWIRSHHVLNIGTYDGGLPPFESYQASKLVGIGPDFLELVTSKVGLAFNVRSFSSRREMIEATRKGTIDVIMNMTPTFTGSKFLRYSQPYTNNDLAILTKRKKNIIIDQLNLKDIKVSTLSGSAEATVLPELYPHAKTYTVNTLKDAIISLELGKTDAFIGNRFSIQTFLNKIKSEEFQIAGNAGLPLSTLHFAFPKNHTTLAAIFDKAISAISEQKKKNIFQNWVTDTPALQARSEGIGLTPDQLNMLTSLPELRVSNLKGYPPFSFANDREEPKGIVEDYFQLVQRQLQLKSVRVPAGSLDELMSLVTNGQVDLIPGMLATEERKEWLSFSKPYTRFPLVIITRQDTINVDSLLSLGKARVAISEHSEPIPAILKENPEITLINTTTVADGLKLLADRDVDAYVGNLVVSDRLINDNYIGILKVSAPTGQYVELSVAVAKKFSYLMPLIDKALDNISNSHREQIRSTWLPIRHDSEINWPAVLKRILPAIILLTITTLIVFISYLRLRREIQNKIEAQRTLANQLRFQNALLETIPFPVLGKDHAGRYIAINSAYEEQFGANRAQMLGRKPEDIGSTDAIAALEQAPNTREAISKGHTLHQTLYFLDKQGKNREGLLWLKPFKNQEEQIVGSVLVLVDVSEIRLSEAKARESEARLTDVTESLPVTVFQCYLATNGDINFSYVAGAPGLTFGLSVESMMSDHKSFYSLIHTEDRHAVQASFERMKATLAPFKIEFRMHIKNSICWVRASTGTGSREQSGIVRWGGYFEDITDAREYKQELKKAKLYAEAATKAKSEFLAMMSHEIRTPVHGVVGWIEILERTKLSIRQLQMLSTIKDSANLLSQVVDDILDFSKLEAGKVRIETTHTDMRVLLDNILDAISSQAIKKNLDLYLYLDQHLASCVLCDPYRMRQILLNLLSNSLKFTQSGGITLRLDILQNTDKEQQISISVSDTGIGVPEHLQAQLFKPFQQAETSTTRRFGGTGLGLSISHGLAVQMGGSLSMYSIPGKGTTVTLTAPFERGPAQVETANYNGIVAVILCDEPLLASALQENLIALKMTVIRVSEFAQLENLEVQSDILFIEDGISPPSWVPPIGSTTRLISLVRRMDSNIELDWERSGKLSSNPLSWKRLVDLCDFWLNGDERDIDIAANDTHSIVSTPFVSREEALKTGKLVLVAEDHPVSRNLIRRQLELLGFACDTVANGNEALDAIGRTSYALVIADYHMPQIDGLELSRMVRKEEVKKNLPYLPIVLLSASALSGRAEECIAAGIDAYLRKPLKLDELREVIERCFSSTKKFNYHDKPSRRTSSIQSEDIDMAHVKEVYGSSDRVRTVLLAVAENLQNELLALEKLTDSNHQAEMIHRMASGLGIIKALPLLRLASELEIGLQQGGSGVDKDMTSFKERIRLLLRFFEVELSHGKAE